MYTMRKRPPARKARRKTQKRWTMAEARKRLPDLVQAASEQPQVLYRRNEIVGAIVGPHELARLALPSQPPSLRSVGAAFAELRRINMEDADDDFELVVAPRTSRPNPFADDDDDVPR